MIKKRLIGLLKESKKYIVQMYFGNGWDYWHR